MNIERHFVTFFSPGTFVAENSTKPIDAWDTKAALSMAAEIQERYGARPYGFQFTTRGRADDELDSRVIAKSPMHYFGVKVETLAQIKARNDPSDRILIGNMECNNWDRIVTTSSGWKWTMPLSADDIVLSGASDE